MSLKWKMTYRWWGIKQWFQGKVWKWLNVDQEVQRRLERDRVYLAAQHRQAVNDEKAFLQRLIHELVQCRVECDYNSGRIYYTTTINDHMLIHSLTDRKYLMNMVADEVAHEFMRLVPITRK